jgi:hypothetical protein
MSNRKIHLCDENKRCNCPAWKNAINTVDAVKLDRFADVLPSQQCKTCQETAKRWMARRNSHP